MSPTYVLPPRILDWEAKLPPFKWNSSGDHALPAEAAQTMDDLCALERVELCEVLLEEDRVAVTVEVAKTCRFGVHLEIKTDSSVGGLLPHKAGPFATPSFQVRNTIVVHALLALLRNWPAPDDPDGAFTVRMTDRVVSALRSVCVNVLKSRTLLFRTHVFALAALAKVPDAPARLRVCYILRVAESLEACADFHAAAAVYLDASALHDDNETGGKANCAFFAAVAFRRAKDYVACEIQYVNYVQLVCRIGMTPDWDSLLTLYKYWDDDKMTVCMELLKGGAMEPPLARLAQTRCVATFRNLLQDEAAKIAQSVRGVDVDLLDRQLAKYTCVERTSAPLADDVAALKIVVAGVPFAQEHMVKPSRNPRAAPNLVPAAQPDPEVAALRRKREAREAAAAAEALAADRARRERVRADRAARREAASAAPRAPALAQERTPKHQATPDAARAAKDVVAREASKEAAARHAAALRADEAARVAALEARVECLRISRAIEQGD